LALNEVVHVVCSMYTDFTTHQVIKVLPKLHGYKFINTKIKPSKLLQVTLKSAHNHQDLTVSVCHQAIHKKTI